MGVAQTTATIVTCLIAGLSAIVTLIASYTLLQHRTEAMSSMEKKLSADLQKTADTVAELTVLVKVQLAQQAVVNDVVSKTLDSLVKRIEQQEAEIRQLQSLHKRSGN